MTGAVANAIPAEFQGALVFVVYRDSTTSIYRADSPGISFTSLLKYVVESAAEELKQVVGGPVLF